MKLIGILILLALGLLIVRFIDKKLNPIEKAGLIFPLGISVISILIILYDLTGIKVTLVSLLTGLLILGVGLFFPEFNSVHGENSSTLSLKKIFRNLKLSKINFTWMFFFGVLSFVVYAITVKTFYWPVLAYDSIAGYDFLARTIVAEAKFNTSIFDPVHSIYTIRHTYPPLVPCAFSYAYFLGFGAPKIISSLYFISSLVLFYGILLRYTDHLSTVVFTLIFATVPELLGMSAFALTNIPHMLYSAFGLLYLYIWYETKNNRKLILATVLLMLGVWTRTEGLVFAAAGGLMVLLNSIETKNWKRLMNYSAGILSVFIVWHVYILFILQLNIPGQFIYDIYWNGDKLAAILRRVIEITFHPYYYGVTVYLFFAIMAVHLLTITVKEGFAAFLKDRGVLLSVLLTAFILYILIFYQLDIYKEGKLVGTWISNGYKRGFFSFIPLLLFYSATNRTVRTFFKKLAVLSGRT